MNPTVTRNGRSTFTTAAGRAFSHSGHLAMPNPVPLWAGSSMISALPFAQSAVRWSAVVTIFKLEEVA